MHTCAEVYEMCNWDGCPLIEIGTAQTHSTNIQQRKIGVLLETRASTRTGALPRACWEGNVIHSRWKCPSQAGKGKGSLWY